MTDQNIVVCSSVESDIKIHKWKVREGFQVTNGQLILLYEVIGDQDKEIKRLKSTNCGIVKNRLFKEGDTVKKGETLLELAECSHTTVIKDMCADCGADLRQNENGNASEASVPMIHSVPELKVTQKRALELGQADTERLITDRKLVLLVDLDQTLIHTTNDNVPNNLKDVYHFQLYGTNSPWYHTRLRPGTLLFLEKMAPIYELHICTFGTRDYAHTIANFLDEAGKLFSHRILSRDECFNATCKTDNLKALFPCGDSMVCIIDDREDVWNMAANLIQVKPYHFFQHTGDINAPPGMSKHELDGKGMDFNDLENKQKDEKKLINIENDTEDENKDNKTELNPEDEGIKRIEVESDSQEKDAERTNEDEETNMINKQSKIEEENKDIEEIEETIDLEKLDDKSNDESNTNQSNDDENLIEIDDPDDYLLYLEEILKKIHQRFYEMYEDTKELPDLKTLVPKMRSEVLIGKNLVFSGLVPHNIKLEQSKAYKIAKSLGANVSQVLSPKTTHLVAVTAGTFKVITARKKMNIKIVTPDWLWTCAERWEHVDERVFPLDRNNPSKMRQPPPHCHSPEHVTNYNVGVKPEQGNSRIISQPEPKFVDTINPLLKFTNADLAKMNEEFEEFFESSESSDDEPIDMESPPINKTLKKKRKREEEEENVNIKFFTRPEMKKIEFATQEYNSTTDKNESTSSDDEMPSTKFRQGGDLPSDLDLGSEVSNGSEPPIDEDDDGDWNMMGAALEREFLGLDQ